MSDSYRCTQCGRIKGEAFTTLSVDLKEVCLGNYPQGCAVRSLGATGKVGNTAAAVPDPMRQMIEGASTNIMDLLIRKISFEIGLCGSVKPERQAEAIVEWLLKHYDVIPKHEHQ